MHEVTLVTACVNCTTFIRKPQVDIRFTTSIIQERMNGALIVTDVAVRDGRCIYCIFGGTMIGDTLTQPNAFSPTR